MRHRYDCAWTHGGTCSCGGPVGTLSRMKHAFGNDGKCVRCLRVWWQVVGTACDTERVRP